MTISYLSSLLWGVVAYKDSTTGMEKFISCGGMMLLTFVYVCYSALMYDKIKRTK